MSGAAWVFDGEDGRIDVMLALVARYLTAVDALVPEEHDDPLAQLASELSQDPESLLEDDPGLARLFPPALSGDVEARQFRRDAIASQARARLDAARTVLADLSLADGDLVEVPPDALDPWVATLSGIRAQWHVELTGDGSRLAVPSRRDFADNPAAAAVLDWVGYLIEDALETKSSAWTPPL